MARSQFPVEVLTPEGQVFEGEVEMVSTRTGTGSLGVLANHAPLMAMLEPTELKLYTSGSDNPGSAEMERFLSQPFFVAEAFTGTPGKYVSVEDTVRSFKEIVDGEHDERPERDFYMKGSIDEVTGSDGS